MGGRIDLKWQKEQPVNLVRDQQKPYNLKSRRGKKRIKKSEESLREMCDTMKHTNIGIKEVPTEKEIKDQKNNIKRINSRNFLSLMKTINPYL